MLTEILERLPPTRGDQHAGLHPHTEDAHRVAPGGAVQVEPGPNDTSRDPVPEGTAQDDAVQVQPQAKDMCDPGLEDAALDDAVQVEIPPETHSSSKSANPRPLLRRVGSMLQRRRNSWEERPTNHISIRIYELAKQTWFEVFFGGLIIINTVVMGLEVQWKGAQVGYQLGFYTFYGSDRMGEDALYMSADSLFRVAEYVFAFLFTIEVTLRMIGSGGQFFKRPSECFDLAVVVVSDISILMDSIDMGINIQVLRLLRASRLFRLVKLCRAIEEFDALHLMVTALGASAWALGWSVLLLVFIQTFSAIIVTQVFRSVYLEEPSNLSEDARLQLFEYFGTFTRSMLSLFELSLANWPPICRWLMENLHEAFMFFALAFKFVMGIAVIGVINSVFMQETFKIAHTDNEIMVRMKTRATSLHKSKMEKLFKLADEDGDERIQRDEFRKVLMDKTVSVWLASMDMDSSDADLIFDLMKGDDDLISVDELITGVSRLRGGARSIDLRRVLAKMDE